MNDQSWISRNSRYLILVLAGLIILLAIYKVGKRHDPSYTAKLTDRDTHETVLSQPNKSAEKSAQNGVILFGSSVLRQGGATDDQTATIRQQLYDYAKNTLHNKYQSLTLMPDTFNYPQTNQITNYDLKGKLRLGQGNTIVNIEIKLSDLYYDELTISSQDNPSLNYNAAHSIPQGGG